MSSMSIDDAAVLEVAERLAREAGALITATVGKIGVAQTKLNTTDVVTETDKAAEELIIKGIRERFPDHSFVAEESYDDSKADYGYTDAPTWLIDPVDGTTNFVHAFPFNCVSIAFAVAKEIRVAVVHCPMLDETFTARKGHGAFLNGKPIKTSSVDTLKGAALVTEFGYDRSEAGVEGMLANISRVLRAEVQGVRALGSCALNLCSVAMGRLDLYYEGKDTVMGPKPWDSAAGTLVVEEAGGVVLDFKTREPITHVTGRVLGANSAELAAQLMQLLE